MTFGMLLGSKLGKVEGIALCFKIGTPLGTDVGLLLGANVNIIEAILDGKELGCNDGILLGTAEGVLLGTRLGTTVASVMA